jgi:hypothetical protein
MRVIYYLSCFAFGPPLPLLSSRTSITEVAAERENLLYQLPLENDGMGLLTRWQRIVRVDS